MKEIKIFGIGVKGAYRVARVTDNPNISKIVMSDDICPLNALIEDSTNSNHSNYTKTYDCRIFLGDKTNFDRGPTGNQLSFDEYDKRYTLCYNKVNKVLPSIKITLFNNPINIFVVDLDGLTGSASMDIILENKERYSNLANKMNILICTLPLSIEKRIKFAKETLSKIKNSKFLTPFSKSYRETNPRKNIDAVFVFDTESIYLKKNNNNELILKNDSSEKVFFPKDFLEQLNPKIITYKATDFLEPDLSPIIVEFINNLVKLDTEQLIKKIKKLTQKEKIIYIRSKEEAILLLSRK